MGEERAVEPLIRLIRSEAYSYGCAAVAAWRLAQRRADPRVLDGLIAGLRVDAEFATVQAVTSALGDIGGLRAARALLAFTGQLIALPPERWDAREDNLSETEAGVVFHVVGTEFRDALSAIRRSDDSETRAALDGLLAGAPPYVAGSIPVGC
jgi:hypothetical protein